MTETGVPFRRTCDTLSNALVTAWARRCRRRCGGQGRLARLAAASIVVVVVFRPLLVSPGRSVFACRLAVPPYEFETPKQIGNV